MSFNYRYSLDSREVHALQEMGWTEERIASCCAPLLPEILGEDYPRFQELQGGQSRIQDELPTIERLQGFHFMVMTSGSLADFLLSRGGCDCRPEPRNYIKSLSSSYYMSPMLGVPNKAAWFRNIAVRSYNDIIEMEKFFESDAPALFQYRHSQLEYLEWYVDKVAKQGNYYVPRNTRYRVLGILNMLKHKGVDNPLIDEASFINDSVCNCGISTRYEDGLILFPNGETDSYIDDFGGIYSKDRKAFLGFKDKSLNYYSIAEGTEYIEGYIINGMPNLESIDFPTSLLYIGGGNFCSCNILKELVFPESVMYFGGGVQRCSSLERVVLPKYQEEVIYICGDNPSLKQVVLPECCSHIFFSFNDCPLLEQPEIPSTLGAIMDSFSVTPLCQTQSLIKELGYELMKTEATVPEKYKVIEDILFESIRENDDRNKIMADYPEGLCFKLGDTEFEYCLDEMAVSMIRPVYELGAPNSRNLSFADIKRKAVRWYITDCFMKEHEEELRKAYADIMYKKAELETHADEFFGPRPSVIQEYNKLRESLIIPFAEDPFNMLEFYYGLENPQWAME